MTRQYNLLPMNLQFFAADGGASGGEGDSGAAGAEGTAGEGAKGTGEGAKGSGGEGEQKTFTQAELDKIIQERLSRAQSKWEKEFETKLNEAKTEAEKLAKMNAEQKAEYERKKREDELAKREGEITRRELRATALESLAEKGLPKQLADILDYTDAESTSKSIESVEKVFRESVEAAVNERLKGDLPKGGGGKGNDGFDAIKQIFAQR